MVSQKVCPPPRHTLAVISVDHVAVLCRRAAGHLKDSVCLCCLSQQASSDGRYLWTQLSSVDNMYESSTEASVPMSTFRSELHLLFFSPSRRVVTFAWVPVPPRFGSVRFAATFFESSRSAAFAPRVGVFVSRVGGECAAKFCKRWRWSPVRRSAFRFPEVQNWLEHAELSGSWTPLWGRLVVFFFFASNHVHFWLFLSKMSVFFSEAKRSLWFVAACAFDSQLSTVIRVVNQVYEGLQFN